MVRRKAEAETYLDRKEEMSLDLFTDTIQDESWNVDAETKEKD